ncbi:MAG TPA: hypothetical protein VMK65_08220 [Longimicrobiales bacterium]|nr:hypothetical protein [Longimicrobiales bacterium]
MSRVGRRSLLATLALAAAAPACAQPAPAGVYRYAYPHATPTLMEDHLLVLGEDVPIGALPPWQGPPPATRRP